MSFKHNFTQNDWDNLTQTTKDDINFALSQELDSIGNFVFNKSEKSVNALIQMAQSLTNPKQLAQSKQNKDGQQPQETEKLWKASNHIQMLAIQALP